MSEYIVPTSFEELRRRAIKWKRNNEAGSAVKKPAWKCKKCEENGLESHVDQTARTVPLIIGVASAVVVAIGADSLALAVIAGMIATVGSAGAIMALATVVAHWLLWRSQREVPPVEDPLPILLIDEYLRARISEQGKRFIGDQSQFDVLRRRTNQAGLLIVQTREELENRVRSHHAGDSMPERFRISIEALMEAERENNVSLAALDRWEEAVQAALQKMSSLVNQYISALSEVELFRQVQGLVDLQRKIGQEVNQLMIGETRELHRALLDITTGLEFRLTEAAIDRTLAALPSQPQINDGPALRLVAERLTANLG